MLLDDARFDFDVAATTCRAFLSSVFPAEFAIARTPGTVPKAARERSSVLDERVSETLPGWVYRNEEFYELERECIFGRHWLLVGHTSHVPEIGDFMTLEAAGERALVVRGRDGALRAFHNVCRHRASRVVRDSRGHCERAIVCPYHGWSYGLDGKLRGVPAEKSFAALDKSRLGLQEIDLEAWMGFVFVRFGGDGPSVAESLRPLEQEASHFRFAEMKPWSAHSTRDCDFDWKVFAENDAEGYHIPAGHPGLRRLFGSSYADDESRGDASRSFSVLQSTESPVWTERAYQRLLPVALHLPEAYQRAWAYYGIFPTSVLQISPDLVDCYQVLPVGPGRCQLRGFSVALEDDRREMRAARYLTSRIVRQIVEEDLDFCRWTDAGIRSSGYPGGVLSSLESGVRELQDRIRELIPVARCRERPAPGTVRSLNEQMSRAR
jgi:phenylpropionate dioxygenase-like ring-hydroxylating dioxygenase large terminal subunit